jgi:N-acyl-D-amino-acid deacylase
MKKTMAFVLVCLGLMKPAWGGDYDLVIRHGRIVDGTGNPAYFADVAVSGGRIAAIGRLERKAARDLDAAGCVVAPGFIDVHTHAENIDDLPLAENYVRMGATTLVLGNCGDSVLELGRFFRSLEERRPAANVATLLGHNTIREKAMGGSFNRPPTGEELAQMQALVAEGMKAGAVGLSTGLIYLPGTFASTEEIIELARAVSPFEGIYVSHMRDEGDEIFKALAEVFRIAREGQVRAQVSHIKLSGKQNWGQAGKVLGAIESARAAGLDVTQDMYVYPASSTGISQLIPTEARARENFTDRLRDPEEKAKIMAAMKERLHNRRLENYDYAMIAHYQKDPSLDGLNIVEAARKKRGRDSVEDQIELILEIQANGGADGVFFGMSEEDLQIFLKHPNTMIGSDSSVRRWGEGVPHPRGYGNSARVLAKYVREEKVLRLEEAVRRMSLLPASTFRLRDRGQLREGAWADMVVFDPDTVQDRATFTEPHQYATGFRWVLVNGVVVVEQDRHTGARPGQVLRRR